MAMLTGMSVHQLNDLNAAIPRQLILENEIRIHQIASTDTCNEDSATTALVRSSFGSDVVCCIEGVYLPIYDAANKKCYQENDVDGIVDVTSTKANMRSIALGISSNKAICLSGPVGCGKTTLVEHLAKLTGRIAPISFADETIPTTSTDDSTKDRSEAKKTTLKRAKSADVKTNSQTAQRMKSNNGFLRIQLGDQTDSKMLLGQYRCTDLPGEFIWQPGVLTQVTICDLSCVNSVYEFESFSGRHEWSMAFVGRYRFGDAGCDDGADKFNGKSILERAGLPGLCTNRTGISAIRNITVSTTSFLSSNSKSNISISIAEAKS